MRKAFVVAFALLAPAGPAASQNPKPAAPAEERPAAAPGPRLNLKLDNPSQYLTETPREKASADRLPSLGADARPLPPVAPDAGTATYPKDSQEAIR